MEKVTQTQSQKSYPEYKSLSLPEVDSEVLKYWQENDIFGQSVTSREGKPSFVFFEGPPSANGRPGIHHVMARTIKDLFCRYKTLKGFQVKRKGGWDTHGLPVELSVEKKLGITKEDIGKKISVADYNRTCRESVLTLKDEWDDVTQKMGYWVDLDHPYVTFDNDYIETVWWILKEFYQKDLLYKGLSIQPYSPAAGTGLSSHELNYTGAYQEVKDTSAVAQFKLKHSDRSAFLQEGAVGEVFCLAWTTTPWTLPSNTALAVGKNIDYVQVNTTNPYTGEAVSVILAKDLVAKNFSPEGEFVMETDDAGKVTGFSGTGKISGKTFDFEFVRAFKGSDLVGISYEQLLPYVQPEGKAFQIIEGDFVTTEDGTGIVHIAPTFGADDMRVAQQNGIASLMVKDDEGNPIPLVDKTGKFVKEMGEFAGRYVKNYKDEPDYVSPDIDISIKLKEENRAWKVEKYEHSYPHCWRTDKPVLYYPLDSWFVRTTSVQDRMVELNKTINWKPASTGEKRFGNWLENLVDWNLSRSRYWGIPLPIWANEDRSVLKCIGSVEELGQGYVFGSHMEKLPFSEALSYYKQFGEKMGISSPEAVFNLAVEKGYLVPVASLSGEKIDLHRPFVDEVVFFSDRFEPLVRETDLIDVWFDSGSMPYAQHHYPFENKELFREQFPADFIAEGVDQTRGWFFTLHAIAVMLFDSVAYKNVISHGLVLDKNGKKMSKRLGNAVTVDEVLPVYGADATRWFMVGTNAPWENLKFNPEGIEEIRRKTFGTIYNTYNFFAMYANLDGFTYQNDPIPLAERSELDRWILSLMNSMVRKVDEAFGNYEPTPAVRVIDDFVDNLSNWYVRLSRRIFWKGDWGKEKEAAYQTLFDCLLTIAKVMSPVAPFFAEKLYGDLVNTTGRESFPSVHISNFPEVEEQAVDLDLEERMAMAREICSLVHSIRKNKDVHINVRTPLQKILIPVTGDQMEAQLDKVKDLILQEVNVKEMGYIKEDDEEQPIVKSAKANFKLLGKKLGKKMKATNQVIMAWGQEEIQEIEREGKISVEVEGEPMELLLEEVEITSRDIPGWKVAVSSMISVAVDVTLTDSLKKEGMAREFINRIQNLRKEMDLELTDRIRLKVSESEIWNESVKEYLDYICAETLADSLELVDGLEKGSEVEIEGSKATILIEV